MRLSAWLAMRCHEASFQRFLGVPSEPEAATKVRALCGVRSRSEIDSDPEAAQRFHQTIRLPYQQFLQDQTKQITETP